MDSHSTHIREMSPGQENPLPPFLRHIQREYCIYCIIYAAFSGFVVDFDLPIMANIYSKWYYSSIPKTRVTCRVCDIFYLYMYCTSNILFNIDSKLVALRGL